jgi:LysR family transcriptional regulator, hydrogen peroxide-inducible genes activator
MIALNYSYMPSLTQLEYLVAVDKYRHFSRAAEACNVSQPSLSMLLQKLEDELGVTIFDRSKKPILTTLIGKAIVAQAKVVLSERNKIFDISKADVDQVSGPFRLGVIPTLAPYVIPLFIDRFSKQYPKVELIIEELKTSDILNHLDEDRIDAGLMATPLKESRFEEKVLFYEPFYLYVSESHPYYKKTRVKESDLSANDIWLLGEGHCLRNQIVKLCSIEKSPGVFKNVQFESGNLETLKRLVDHSAGYTLLPHLAVADITDTATKRKIKPFIKPLPTREVSLVFRRKNLKEKILLGLADVIVKSVPQRLFEIKENDIEIVDI